MALTGATASGLRYMAVYVTFSVDPN